MKKMEEMVLPKNCKILSKEEKEMIEGGKKDTIARIQDILEKLLYRK